MGMHAAPRPPADGHGLVAIYVRLPGSPDLAQHLCSEAAASSLRCRTAAEDGIAAELESRGKHGNLLLTTPTAPAEATVPSGAFYFVSLTNPLEALSASPLTSTTRNAPRRNPQCAALLPEKAFDFLVFSDVLYWPKEAAAFGRRVVDRIVAPVEAVGLGAGGRGCRAAGAAFRSVELVLIDRKLVSVDLCV